MSDLYAPFTPTPGGAVIGAQIGAYYRWVYIKNSSGYDLLYSLSPDKPQSTAIYQEWSGRIEPGHGAIITIPSQKDIVSAQWQADNHGVFNGTIWLALLNYAGTLALTGTASAVTNVWITGYFEWEGYPYIDASLANGSQYQQPRVISLYPALVPFLGTFSATASGSASLQLGGAVVGYTISAANFTNGNVVVYLYGGWLYGGNQASNGQIQLIAFVADISGSPLGTGQVIWQGQVWSAGITPRTHDVVPLVNGAVLPYVSLPLAGLPTAQEIIMQIKCTGLQGITPFPVDYNVIWGIDTENLSPPVPNGYRLALAIAGGANGPF